MGTTALFLVITASLLFIAYILRTVYVEMKRAKIFKEEEGVRLFKMKIHTMDYFDLINSLVSYIMIYREIDLHDFFDRNTLRLGKDADFHFIEESINHYPIVACTYIGDGRYKLNEYKMSEKYAYYQEQTKRDDYLIPLFDLTLINKYPELFNYSMKFQQTINTKNMLNTHLGDRFDEVDLVLEDLEDYENIILLLKGD